MALNQRVKHNPEMKSPYQYELAIGPNSLERPAVVVPVAWLLQLYATLDRQENALTRDQLLKDLHSIFVRHCNLVGADLANINISQTYDYKITIKDDEGRLDVETLVAADDEHAREEAAYEYDGEVVKVERGERLPNPLPWHEWPE